MNIVFDLGGVVFDWAPQRYAALAFDDPAKRTALLEHVVRHADWLALDAGTLPLEDAIQRGSQRSGLSEAELRHAFARLPDVLTPIEPTVQLIRDLHATDSYPLFVLSNMHHVSADHLESAHDFWPLFRACVFSCRIGLIKPDPAIFDHLLRSESLEAGNTVFIDDMSENVEAAQALGLKTVLFKNAGQCRRDLAQLGVTA